MAESDWVDVDVIDQESDWVDVPDSQVSALTQGKRTKQNIIDLAVKKAGRLFGIPENIPVPTSEQIATASPGMGSLVMGALNQGSRDALTIPANFFNQYTLNSLRSLSNTAGLEMPTEASTMPAQVLNKAAGVAGALTSPVMRAGAGLMKAPLSLANLAKIAGVSGAVGAAYAPNDNFFDMGQRATQGAIGAVSGPAAKVAGEGVRRLPGFVKSVVNNIKNVKNPVQFSQNVRKVLFNQKKAVGDAFESGIQKLSRNNPTKQVDLSDAFNYIKSSIDDIENNPGLAAEIKGALRKIRNPELAKMVQDLIDDPVKAKKLTLAQSQEIKTIIQQATSISGKVKQGAFAQYKPGDLELLDLIDEIKLSQSEVFPEMAKIREPYAKYMSAYRVVKNKFKPGSLLEKMRNGFGDEEIQKMVEVVLPGDTVKQIAGFRMATKGINAAMKIGGAGVALEGGRRLLKSAMGG